MGIAAVALCAALVPAGPAAASGPPAWAVQKIPVPQVANGQLDGIACSGPSSCMAVGLYLDGSSKDAALAEYWNGTSWKLEPAADPSGSPYIILNAVSCTSAKACTAVGNYDDSAGTPLVFAERWNGTTWTVQSTPEPANSSTPSLTGVSCTAASACIAVGTYYDSDAGADAAYSERWNGHTWALHAVTGPADAQRTSFEAVSCPSSTDCTAVGFYTDSSDATQPLAESWNGTTWQAQTTPPGASGAVLWSVSCSLHACMAVGRSGFDTATYAQSWDGTSWQIRGTVNSAKPINVLSGVSCTTPTACTAVGYTANSAGHQQPLSERWNGATWTIQSIPSAKAGTGASLSGDSCPSATDCIAVGIVVTPWRATLAVVWKGTTWKGQNSANRDGAPTSYLGSVSCSSRVACMAIGGYINSSGHQVTFAERLSGTHWHAGLPATVKGAVSDTLTSVSCTSAKACTAVGYSANSATADTALVERWNGKVWQIEKTPSMTNSAFLGVSCASSTMCMAVGVPGAQRWNGRSWQALKVPTPTGKRGIVLNAVSCPAAKSCTAVGGAGSQYDYVSLIAHWNGSRWKIEKAANPPLSTQTSSSFELNGVSCATSSACTAVGTATYGGYIEQYAEMTSGSSWKITLTTGAKPRYGNLVSVSCAATNACVAVGIAASLAERWNGHSWAFQHTPKAPPGFTAGLGGVSCTSDTRCIAVGSQSNSVSNVARVLRYA
ncbi:MAG TPA: hypothetical protein VFE19_04940 [Jatrophihabitantaceae bacterium]|nr:hypothetical protein [Jatrophihabitantaceae bacterium]